VVGKALSVSSRKPVLVRGEFSAAIEKLRRTNAFFMKSQRFVRHLMARIYQHDPCVFRAITKNWPGEMWEKHIAGNVDFTTEDRAWGEFEAVYSSGKMMWAAFQEAQRHWEDTLDTPERSRAISAAVNRLGGRRDPSVLAIEGQSAGKAKAGKRQAKKRSGKEEKVMVEEEEEGSDEHIPSAQPGRKSYGSKKPIHCWDHFFKSDGCEWGSQCYKSHSDKESDWKSLLSV